MTVQATCKRPQKPGVKVTTPPGVKTAGHEMVHRVADPSGAGLWWCVGSHPRQVPALYDGGRDAFVPIVLLEQRLTKVLCDAAPEDDGVGPTTPKHRVTVALAAEAFNQEGGTSIIVGGHLRRRTMRL